jgi:hypothetical protein
MNLKFLILVFFLSLSANHFSQTNFSVRDSVKIVLNDRSELYGNIIKEDSLNFEIQTFSDLWLKIDKHAVKKIEDINKLAETVYLPHKNNTRLLFSPTAITLEPGRAYFLSTQIFFPSFMIGAADFLSLGGGISLFPWAESQIIYFTPKVRFISINGFDIGAAASLISAGGEMVGLTYALSTYSNDNLSLTMGLGWGFSDGETSSSPAIILGGIFPITKHSDLVSENWIIPNSEFQLASLALRIKGENIAGDIGLVLPINVIGSGFPLIPWVGFAYNF